MNSSSDPETMAPTARQNLRVLIVDDEPSVVALGVVILQSNGCNVEGVGDGTSALEAIARANSEGAPFEAVVLDITLPGGPSGFEVMEAIQECHPRLPVIACSGYFQEDARDLCKSLGFADILQKPYTPDRLVGCIRRAHQAVMQSSTAMTS